MAGSVFDLDVTYARTAQVACICHGESEGRSFKRRVAPKTLLVSTAVVRPLLELTAARMLSEHCAVPVWSQSPHRQQLPLLLADRWVEKVSLLLREPALGLMALADAAKHGGNVVEFAAARAPRLIDALLVMAQLGTAVNEGASMHLRIEGRSAIMSVGSLFRLSHVLRDYLVGSLALAVSRWLAPGTRVQVWFAGPRPSYWPAYLHALGDVSVGFHAPYDALALPAASLQAAMPLADPKLHDFLVRVAQRLALNSARERAAAC